MTDWVRFAYGDTVSFGTVQDDTITVHRGDMFDAPEATGQQVALSAVQLLPPVEPRAMIGLWNNFHERAAKEGLSPPEDPLYFLKPASCFLPHRGTIRRPPGHSGRIIFEAELGVVIGRQCAAVAESDAPHYIFGFTCVNDVTAVEIINHDPSFQQWVRAKGFDTFGACGPHIRTGVDPAPLRVKGVLSGRDRQDYPVADMIFSPYQLVSRISHYMTLRAGDVIACGTSVGARPMKDGDRIEIVIDGVGTLENVFRDQPD